ncbi:MAG: flagellar hook-basal body complex protein FliE [Terriglobia bacterium]
MNTISGMPPIDPALFQSPATAPNAAQQGGGGFLDTLKETLGQAQQMQTDADQKVSTLMSGKGGEDVQSVLLALEKSDLSFQLVMQARNKIVQAYQEISNLQF